MASLLIVSGSPGTGKTTVSAALAASASRGLHLASDSFYRFPVRLVDPTTPASHRQNASIMRALGRAAGAFVQGGYDVFLDGVIGPWFLPLVCDELQTAGVAAEYVVLRATLDQAVARVCRRDGSGASGRVRHMHRAFSQLGDLESHVLDTSGLSPAEVRARVERRRAAGELRLSRDAPAGELAVACGREVDGRHVMSQAREPRIARSDDELHACGRVLRELRPHVAEEVFVGRVRAQERQGYRLAYLEDAAGPAAVAGFRILENLAWGRFLYVDDLVTRSDARSQGHGARLLCWLRELARSEGCDELHLDSGVQRTDAHRFYEREGLRRTSYHFGVALGREEPGR